MGKISTNFSDLDKLQQSPQPKAFEKPPIHFLTVSDTRNQVNGVITGEKCLVLQHAKEIISGGDFLILVKAMSLKKRRFPKKYQNTRFQFWKNLAEQEEAYIQALKAFRRGEITLEDLQFVISPDDDELFREEISSLDEEFAEEFKNMSCKTSDSSGKVSAGVLSLFGMMKDGLIDRERAKHILGLLPSSDHSHSIAYSRARNASLEASYNELKNTIPLLKKWASSRFPIREHAKTFPHQTLLETIRLCIKIKKIFKESSELLIPEINQGRNKGFSKLALQVANYVHKKTLEEVEAIEFFEIDEDILEELLEASKTIGIKALLKDQNWKALLKDFPEMGTDELIKHIVSLEDAPPIDLKQAPDDVCFSIQRLLESNRIEGRKTAQACGVSPAELEDFLHERTALPGIHEHYRKFIEGEIGLQVLLEETDLGIGELVRGTKSAAPANRVPCFDPDVVRICVAASRKLISQTDARRFLGMSSKEWTPYYTKTKRIVFMQDAITEAHSVTQALCSLLCEDESMNDLLELTNSPDIFGPTGTINTKNPQGKIDDQLRPVFEAVSANPSLCHALLAVLNLSKIEFNEHLKSIKEDQDTKSLSSFFAGDLKFEELQDQWEIKSEYLFIVQAVSIMKNNPRSFSDHSVKLKQSDGALTPIASLCISSYSAHSINADDACVFLGCSTVQLKELLEYSTEVQKIGIIQRLKKGSISVQDAQTALECSSFVELCQLAERLDERHHQRVTEIRCRLKGKNAKPTAIAREISSSLRKGKITTAQAVILVGGHQTRLKSLERVIEGYRRMTSLLSWRKGVVQLDAVKKLFGIEDLKELIPTACKIIEANTLEFLRTRRKKTESDSDLSPELREGIALVNKRRITRKQFATFFGVATELFEDLFTERAKTTAPVTPQPAAKKPAPKKKQKKQKKQPKAPAIKPTAPRAKYREGISEKMIAATIAWQTKETDDMATLLKDLGVKSRRRATYKMRVIRELHPERFKDIPHLRANTPLSKDEVTPEMLDAVRALQNGTISDRDLRKAMETHRAKGRAALIESYFPAISKKHEQDTDVKTIDEEDKAVILQGLCEGRVSLRNTFLLLNIDSVSDFVEMWEATIPKNSDLHNLKVPFFTKQGKHSRAAIKVSTVVKEREDATRVLTSIFDCTPDEAEALLAHTESKIKKQKASVLSEEDPKVYEAFHLQILNREDVQLLCGTGSSHETYRHLKKIEFAYPELAEKHGVKKERKVMDIEDQTLRFVHAYGHGFISAELLEEKAGIDVENMPTELKADALVAFRTNKIMTPTMMVILGCKTFCDFVKEVYEVAKVTPEKLESLLFRKGVKSDEDGAFTRIQLVAHRDNKKITDEEARVFLGLGNIHSTRVALSRIRKKHGISPTFQRRIELNKELIPFIQRYFTEKEYTDVQLAEDIEVNSPSNARYRAQVYFEEFPNILDDLEVLPSRDPRQF